VHILTFHENITKTLQAGLGQVKLLLAALIMTHLLLQLLVNLDGARGTVGMTGDVEEVHVGIEETHLHQKNRLRASRNLVFQLELLVALILQISLATCHVLFVLVETVASCFLSAVLLEYLGLGLFNELVALLTLALLHDLTNLGVGVQHWIQLHVVTKYGFCY